MSQHRARTLRHVSRAMVAGTTLALFSLAAIAQATAPAKPAAPSATAQKPAAPKPATAKPAAQRAAAPAAAAALAAATPEQMLASDRTHFGDYACEFDQKVLVKKNARSPGYVDVDFKGRTIVTKPVLSSTGALRLEDVTGRMVMIQIANKSMLMDTKIGQRVVDNCVHPEQAKFQPQTS